MSKTLIASILTLLLAACGAQPAKVTPTDAAPPMYPDYTDITIPENIAPLNFLLRDRADAVRLIVDGHTLASSGSSSLTIRLADWKRLMRTAAGKTLTVVVLARKNGRWIEYRPFHWTVVTDKIDPYLTYRLIEPDYEVFQNVEIRERCVENFDQRAVNTYKVIGNKCMNCHMTAHGNPDLSMMYVRGEGGGAILNRYGNLSKLNIKTDDMVSGSVYFDFSPNGRYIVFSSNIIIPAFHSMPSKRLEVFDSRSDIYAADINTRTIVRSPLLDDSLRLETFPTFTPDGHYVLFCSALRADKITDLQYSLCRVAFDEERGAFGTVVDTLVHARDGSGSPREKSSVCHPRVSPDGRYVLYTVAYYGTFPVWHPEADLRMMDLRTGAVDTLAAVNSESSDTYHSWSSNSRWFVFASKRDDGLYGKPYFSYVDREGKAHKPFVLPQRDPLFYDYNLKSFNTPELCRGRLPFKADDVKKALGQKAESFASDLRDG